MNGTLVGSCPSLLHHPANIRPLSHLERSRRVDLKRKRHEYDDEKIQQNEPKSSQTK
jgi:hypothetical protein